MDAVTPYMKAVIAFLAPGIVALVAAVQDSSAGGSTITGPEWVGIAAACVLTAAGVYAVPNRDPKALHQDESVQPPRGQAGYGAIELLVGVVLLVILVVVLLRLI